MERGILVRGNWGRRSLSRRCCTELERRAGAFSVRCNWTKSEGCSRQFCGVVEVVRQLVAQRRFRGQFMSEAYS
ncbi:hypothetical protein VNO80_06816 [Phaseolus coccineus]|uniref:Uncharacterized protein n=1 Tax=Phaseolus coccineus TaxID=3886 RepID=A0AAN9NHJ2_PHACN